MLKYEAGDVSVDQAFARFGSKSFAINKITSVDVRSTDTPGAWGFYVWWALAVFVTIGAIVNLAQGYNPVVNLVVASALGAIGFASFGKRREFTTYRLFLHTAGSEAQAYETTDQREIKSLRNALETSMAESI